MDNLKGFLREHKWRILLVGGGVLLTILFLSIGFWRTILLSIVACVCYILGMLLDRDGGTGIHDFFASLFGKN